jgi:hypothetical protein
MINPEILESKPSNSKGPYEETTTQITQHYPMDFSPSTPRSH